MGAGLSPEPGNADELLAACPFCRIAAGLAPAEVVASSEEYLVIRDLRPQAPVHLLALPRRHVRDIAQMSAGDPESLGRLVNFAVATARSEGLDVDGFRLVVNTGLNGGQTVDHLHIHVLGGRRLGWPPG